MTVIDDRLARAVDALGEHLPQLAPRSTDELRRRGRRRRSTTIAGSALVLAAIVVAAAAVTTGRQSPTIVSTSAALPPAPRPVPAATPEPGSMLPDVADPPPWLAPLEPGRADGPSRTGTWTSAGFARPVDGGGYESPITVSVFDGTWSALDGATTINADGIQLLRATSGAWTVVATGSQPTVAVSGQIDQAALLSVLLATRVAPVRRAGESTPSTQTQSWGITVDQLPAGYVPIAPAQVLAAEQTTRWTLHAGSTLTISDISDLVDPLLAASLGGAHLDRHEIDGVTLWTGTGPTTYNGTPITFVIWSPMPGVVFELDNSDTTRSTTDLVALAGQTVAISADQWRQRHLGEPTPIGGSLP